MPAQGRKNVHGKTGVRFKAAYTSSKEKAMLRNVASELIVHGSVKVTSGVTPKLITLASKLITWGKENTLASRRYAERYVKDVQGVDTLNKLFDEVAPKYATRNGGYFEVYKLGARRGDNAEVELVKLID